MNEYIIATVSTSDLDASWMKEHNVPFISYTYTLDDQIFIDDCTEEAKVFLMKCMREGKLPNTSQINQYAYEEFFRSLLSSGRDVLFVDMTRAISASIINCERAVTAIREEFPERKLYFLDSYCVTGGLALLIKQMVQRKENGLSIDEVYAWGEAHKMEFVQRFMVDDLSWLQRGGRLSNAEAFFGKLLTIKPLIQVDNEGKLTAYNKVHGRKKAIRTLVESIGLDLADHTGGEEMIILSADCDEDCETVCDKLRETYPQLKDTKMSIVTIGPVIGAHVGPGFIGITYHGNGRRSS